MTKNINISNLDKAKVLAALYNKAQVQGVGVFQADKSDMPICMANFYLDCSDSKYFDYVKGRVLKVNLSGDSFDPIMYDRDNGPDAAANALKAAGIEVECVDVEAE